MSTRSESSVSSDGSSRHAPAAPAAAAAERAKGPRSSVGSSSRLATAAPAAAVARTEGRRSSGGMAHTQGRRSSESTAHTEGRRSSGGTARTKGRQSSGGSSGVALGKAEGAGAHAGGGDDGGGGGGGGGTSKGAPLGNSASNAHGATANGGSGGSDDGTNGVPTNNVASQGRGEEVGGESGKGDKRGRPGPQGARGRAPKGMMASPPTVSTELALKAKAAAYLMRFQAEQALQGHTITGKGPSALAVVQHGKDGKKDGSLKPGELGAEYAWAMSNEVSEAKRSPRVSSAEDLGAEYSWATGAGQGGASTPAGQQARAGAKKGFKETGPTRHAHAPRSDRTSSGAAASKPTPASARVPATRGGASLPPSKRKAEDDAPTASPLPSTAGAHGDARTRGPITPGAAATAAAAALHARAGEHGAAGAAAAAALRGAPQGGAAAATANGGIGGDGPMQKLLAEFGKQPPPSPPPQQQQQQQQRPASPKQNISAPKPGQQHMLPGTLHQHGKEEAADAYRKFAADDAHPSTAASAPLDLDRPPSPRTSAAAAAAAALGMRSTPNITMHDGIAASPAPYSSSRSSPPRTPTTAAAAAAAAALAPASRAGSGSPGRPANNASASIAAILQTAPFALNPPELGIPSIPPPCHQPHGHAHTPLSPNHEAPNPYTGPFHHSSSMLPSSPPSNHAAYAADAMLNKPDWARPVHTTSQGMPDPHVPRVPGVGYPGPVHVVVPTDPMPSPPLSPLTSPRGLPPSTYGASLGVPPPPITYGAGIGVPSSPPSAYGASMGVAPPTPSTFGASMGVPSPPPNTYSAGMGAPPPPSTYSASMGVAHPPPSTYSAGMGAAPFYPQVYPGSLQQDAGVAPSNMQGPQVGPLPVQQQQQQQQQGLRQQQLQRQPEADVAQVLQQLQTLGYTVPEHAAQVLQILLKDANRNDLSSGGALKDPQGVAQQLWAAGDGPSPTSAGPGLQPPISQARPQGSAQALQEQQPQQQQHLHQHQHQHQHQHPHSHLQGIQEDSAEEDGRDPIPQGPEGVAKEDLPGRGTQELRGTKSRRSSNAGSEMHAGSVSSSAQQSFSGWVRAPAAQQGRTSRSSQHRPDDPQRAAKAEAAQRRAPSAPRKGPASGSTQGAARPLQRPSQPQSPSRPARDSGPGAAGDYYHDTRGGKITMSGPSAMEAWRSASAPDKPPTTHTTPATGVPGAAGASALRGLHSWGKTGGGAGRAGPPKPGSRPSSPRTARSSPQRQLSKGRPVSPRVHGQARPLQVVGGGGSILDGVENGQQVVLLRPPKWQERDTRQWLSSLSLDLLPEEETAPMLENPLRNGVLLCDVAAAVTGAPIPDATCEPPDQQAARSNILLALDHLGLLDLFDDSQLEKMTKASPEDAKALIKSKHVNSYARGYAQKLKEQQLKVGMSLMVEVEKVLQGNQDATWGLLNHLRCICTGEAPSSRAPSRSSSRGTSPARPSSSKGRPSSPGQRASGPHVSNPKHNALTSAALPSSPPRAAVALRGPASFASPQRSSRNASPSIRTSAGGTPQRIARRNSRPSSPALACMHALH
ncbi:hypothetical protein DUNSADRAFT_1336 [Dunaliella salina]|uniref:UBA domain-containing protein n=1 Tax=Dunaliella salina TaxID=3046 RepID=A0ABQ7GX79_DUNSA|nr:hypothetical protein DUNSADRAFT_1336 [Dunaliella salina]|eukprot:KAF5839199.1 hypothetical protein DUNSADRAFT_1336 [Dunaliella salina]